MSADRAAHGPYYLLWHLHELDGRAVGIAHINDALARVWPGGQYLRSACRLPARGSDFVQHSVESVHDECDMNMSYVAGPQIDTLSISGREIFKQFDLVSIALQHRDFDLRAGNASDFAGELAGVMRGVGQLESQPIAPKGK